MAAESTHFEHLTCASVVAGVPETGIDLVLAIGSMESGRTLALVGPHRLRQTCCAVVAGETVACITLCQHMWLGLARADEVIGQCRHEQLATHRTGLDASSDSVWKASIDQLPEKSPPTIDHLLSA